MTSRTVYDLLAHDRFTVIGNNSGGAQCKAWLESQGKTNIEVMDEIVPRPGAYVIGTYRQRTTAVLLMDIGVERDRIFPFVNDMFAPHYGPDIRVPFTGFGDEESEAYLVNLAGFYKGMRPWLLNPNPKRIGHYGYNAPGANPKPGYRIIDAGAYTGDTLPEFLDMTGGACSIHAFETDLLAFEELARNVPPQCHAEKVRLAAYTDEKTGRFRLDDLIEPYWKIDYIKIDVEGDDLDVLHGAERLIEEGRPTIACAAYHKPEHLTQIADFLQERLAPCKIYAGHDPKCWWHVHYIAVPEERAQ